MNNDITHGHLRACTCGAGKPCQGWYAPPTVHYVTCAGCGVWIEGKSEDETTIAWNRNVIGRERNKQVRARLVVSNV